MTYEQKLEKKRDWRLRDLAKTIGWYWSLGTAWAQPWLSSDRKTCRERERGTVRRAEPRSAKESQTSSVCACSELLHHCMFSEKPSYWRRFAFFSHVEKTGSRGNRAGPCVSWSKSFSYQGLSANSSQYCFSSPGRQMFFKQPMFIYRFVYFKVTEPERKDIFLDVQLEKKRCMHRLSSASWCLLHFLLSL